MRDLNTRLAIRAASVEIRTTSGITILQVTTDGDGHFIFFGGVDAGDYFLVFTAAGYEQYVMMLSHRGNTSWDVSLRRSAPGAAAAFAEIDRLPVRFTFGVRGAGVCTIVGQIAQAYDMSLPCVASASFCALPS